MAVLGPWLLPCELIFSTEPHRILFQHFCNMISGTFASPVGTSSTWTDQPRGRWSDRQCCQPGIQHPQSSLVFRGLCLWADTSALGWGVCIIVTPNIASRDLCALWGRFGECQEEPPLFEAHTGSVTWKGWSQTLPCSHLLCLHPFCFQKMYSHTSQLCWE